MTFWSRRTLCILMALPAASLAGVQSDGPLVTRGFVELGGKQIPYSIQHLPPASYPQLPQSVADELNQRGCLIPQTYEAHRPENVVHGSFEAEGSSDWAVLCSVSGQIKLLVFFAGNLESPMTLDEAAETQRLQVHRGSAELGFNWGIDPASPQSIHDLRIGMRPRPRRLDHDALADSIIGQRAVYRYFSQGAWAILDMPR